MITENVCVVSVGDVGNNSMYGFCNESFSSDSVQEKIILFVPHVISYHRELHKHRAYAVCDAAKKEREEKRGET